MRKRTNKDRSIKTVDSKAGPDVLTSQESIGVAADVKTKHPKWFRKRSVREDVTTTKFKKVNALPKYIPKIPQNLGLTKSQFRSYIATDEETFVPLAIAYGHYWPFGAATYTTGDYLTYTNAYKQKILSELRLMGFANPFTTTNLNDYLIGVSVLLQLHEFLTDILTLNRFSAYHTGIPITGFCNSAMNGRLRSLHQRLNGILATLPMPEITYKLYQSGFGATTLSDDPNSGIRLFAPKMVQPVTPGSALSADTLFTDISAYITAFFSVQTNLQLASTLPFSGAKLELIRSTPITKNGNAINNLLNHPYYDGVAAFNPNYAVDALCPIFYRDELELEGLLTFAATARGNSTVWIPSVSTESNFNMDAFLDNGTTIDVVNDVNVFNASGRIWESAVGLEPPNCPSVSKIEGSQRAIAAGIAELVLKL